MPNSEIWSAGTGRLAGLGRPGKSHPLIRRDRKTRRHGETSTKDRSPRSGKHPLVLFNTPADMDSRFRRPTPLPALLINNAFVAELARVPTDSYDALNSGEFSYELLA